MACSHTWQALGGLLQQRHGCDEVRLRGLGQTHCKRSANVFCHLRDDDGCRAVRGQLHADNAMGCGWASRKRCASFAHPFQLRICVPEEGVHFIPLCLPLAPALLPRFGHSLENSAESGLWHRGAISIACLQAGHDGGDQICHLQRAVGHLLITVAQLHVADHATARPPDTLEEGNGATSLRIHTRSVRDTSPVLHEEGVHSVQLSTSEGKACLPADTLSQHHWGRAQVSIVGHAWTVRWQQCALLSVSYSCHGQLPCGLALRTGRNAHAGLPPPPRAVLHRAHGQ